MIQHKDTLIHILKSASTIKYTNAHVHTHTQRRVIVECVRKEAVRKRQEISFLLISPPKLHICQQTAARETAGGVWEQHMRACVVVIRIGEFWSIFERHSTDQGTFAKTEFIQCVYLSYKLNRVCVCLCLCTFFSSSVALASLISTLVWSTMLSREIDRQAVSE